MGLEIGCDCGTVTQLIVTEQDIEQLRLGGGQEFPFTCDGCNSTHWFWAGPSPDPEGNEP